MSKEWSHRRGRKATALLTLTVLTLAFLVPAQAGGPANLSSSTAASRSPAVAVTLDGTLHVVWEEGEGLYHAWVRGNTLSGPQRISIEGEHPALLADRFLPDTVYLAWDEPFGDTQEIFAMRWQGGQWGLPRNVSQTEGYSAQPALAQHADGTLVLVWSDTTAGVLSLYRATSADGEFWPEAAPIPGATGTQPRVATVGDREHLIWLNRPSLLEPTRLLWSRQSGTGWTLPEVLSDPTRPVQGLALAGDAAGRAWVAWNEAGDVVLRAWDGTAWGRAQTLALDAEGQVAVARSVSRGPVTVFWTGSEGLYRATGPDARSGLVPWWAPGVPVADVSAAALGDRVGVGWSQQQRAWDVWVSTWAWRDTWVPLVTR